MNIIIIGLIMLAVILIMHIVLDTDQRGGKKNGYSK
jgi:hypothetical protein